MCFTEGILKAGSPCHPVQRARCLEAPEEVGASVPASERFQSHQGTREGQQEHLLPGGMARAQGGGRGGEVMLMSGL